MSGFRLLYLHHDISEISNLTFFISATCSDDGISSPPAPESSVIIDNRKIGVVFGGFATRLKTTEKAQQVEEGSPVSIYGVERIVTAPGDTINFNEFNFEQRDVVDVENGEIIFRNEE